MSLVDLSKEQKQYLVLGVIAAIILVVLIVFGVKVSLSSISVARVEINELTEKIESAERVVSLNQRDGKEFRATIAELRTHLENIPPDRNYYSWATEIIYDEARKVHFEIDAVDETGIAAAVENVNQPRAVELESYALRIHAHGGYENVKQFLRRIATNHPLVRITGFEISTGARPDVHDVQLFIEWPFNMGYLAESWKSVPQRRSTVPVEPAAASENVESDPEKEPEQSNDNRRPV